jgi:tetratricopeptide (TPR) repeat protein
MLAACASDPAPVAAPGPVGAADFETTIARLEKPEPQSPEALNARLEYADFLSDIPAGAGSDDCRKRLDAAQAQFDILTARPAVRVLLLLGPARLANTAYKIHAARADCDPANRQGELQQALEAARSGAALYREAMDYQSAAVMQFNVAATEQELGEDAAALRELRAAIALDREFGFRDDAEDNMALLLRWTHADDSDTALAAAMKDFPARSLEFMFGWSAKDADVAIAADDVSLVEGKPIQSQGTISLARKITAGASDWTVTNEPGFAQYQLGDWPADEKRVQWAMFFFLASDLMQAPGIRIAHNGNFGAVTDARDFGNRLAMRVSTRLDQLPSLSDAATMAATARDVKAAYSPEFVEASAALDYGIETGTWIGAKLTQGTWYQMTTPLFLPALGLGHYLVNQDVTFAFTREVPCTAAAPDHLCAEIVLRATPTADDLKQTMQAVKDQFKLPASRAFHYWAQTYIRLVVDPATLLPYVRDIRQSWFSRMDPGEGARDELIIEQTRAVSTVSYH